MGVKDRQLVVAIVQHDMEATRSLLLDISNVDFQTKQRRTALHAAVQHNNITAATMLLERGASMNVLPCNKTEQTILQCPMLLVFEMGESHEEMQLLFLHRLKVVCHTWWRPPDQAIIAAIPKYAMQYSTPSVFFEATGEDGGKTLRSDGGIDSLSPLMHTLKEIALFSMDPAKCAKTMENVLEIVDRFPGMAWERLRAPRSFLSTVGIIKYPEGSTALGMLVFQSMAARHKKNIEFAKLGMQIVRMQVSIQPASEVLLGNQHTVTTDQHNNTAILAYMNTEFIPKIFTKMLRQMQVALAMVTHVRLGAEQGCCARGLSTDMIDIIFSGLVRGIVESPTVVKKILC